MNNLEKLEKAKTYGFIGSLLIFGTLISDIGLILAIASIVLCIIAVKNISDFLEDREIFKNYIKGVVINIIGSIIGVIFVIIPLTTFLFSAENAPQLNIFIKEFLNSNKYLLILFFVVGVIVYWISTIIWAYFVRKSFIKISEKLNNLMFKKTADFYLIGAFLEIILVGVLILLIGIVLQTIAFYEINSKKFLELQTNA